MEREIQHDEAAQSRREQTSENAQLPVPDGLTARQQRVLALQHTHGNAAVRRMLKRGTGTIQRQDPPIVSGGSGPGLGGAAPFNPLDPRLMQGAIQQTLADSDRRLVQWIERMTPTLLHREGTGMPRMVAFVQENCPEGRGAGPERIQQVLTEWARQHNTIIPQQSIFGTPQPASGGGGGSGRQSGGVQGSLSYSLVSTHHTDTATGAGSSDTQHQYAATLTWQMHEEGQEGVELSAAAQVAFNQDYTQVASVQVTGQAAWVRPALNGLLQYGPFVQAMVGGSAAPIAGSTSMTIAPTAGATFGAQALFQLYGGRVQIGAQAGVGPTVTLPPGGPPQGSLDVSVGSVVQFTF